MSKIMAFILCALLSCWGTKSEDKSSVRSQDLSGNDRNEGEQNLQNIFNIINAYEKNNWNLDTVEEIDSEKHGYKAISIAIDEVDSNKIDWQSERKKSLIQLAVEYSSPSDIRKAADKGANVNIVDGKGNSLLHLAVSRGDLDVIKEVAELKNLDKSAKNQRGLGAINMALENGNKEIVYLLVENGIYNSIPEDMSEEMKIALSCSSYLNLDYEGRLLKCLREGESINSIDKSKDKSFLDYILFIFREYDLTFNHLNNFLNNLKKSGIDVERRDKDRNTPLLNFVTIREKKSEKFLNYYLENFNPKLDVISKERNNILMAIATNGSERIFYFNWAEKDLIVFLIKKGADPTYIRPDRGTILNIILDHFIGSNEIAEDTEAYIEELKKACGKDKWTKLLNTKGPGNKTLKEFIERDFGIEEDKNRLIKALRLTG